MSFTKEQEAYIEKIIYKVVDLALPRIIEVHALNCPAVKPEDLIQAINNHTEKCPTGRKLKTWKAVLIGVAIGIGVATSSGNVLALVKLII